MFTSSGTPNTITGDCSLRTRQKPANTPGVVSEQSTKTASAPVVNESLTQTADPITLKSSLESNNATTPSRYIWMGVTTKIE